MPPTAPGDVSPPPPPPDRRSSAANIFLAFRNLTSSGRTKSSSQSAALPPTLTPARSTSVSTTTSDGQTYVQDKASVSGPESASGASHSISEDGPSIVTHSALSVFGGPPELGRLLAQVSRSQPMSERISAALSIRKIQDNYTLSAPLAIWLAGEDLVRTSSEETMKAGLSLLVGCAGSKDLSSQDRHLLFEALRKIEMRSSLFEFWIQALMALTNGGKNVEAIESEVLPFLARLYPAAYENVDNVRKARRTNDLDHETVMDDICRFTIALIKFNAKVFDEDDLDSLAKALIHLCQTTTAFADVQNGMKVLSTLLTFTRLPQQTVSDSLELVADVYRQVEVLCDPAWEVLTKILTSHLAQPALLMFYAMIRDGGSEIKKMVCRGALRIVCRLIRHKDSDALPDVQMGTFLQAVGQGLQKNDQLFAQEVLDMFRDLVWLPDLRTRLEQEIEWETFSRCVAMSADILELHYNDSSANEKNTHGSLTEITNSATATPNESVDSIPDPLSKKRNKKEKVDKLGASMNLYQINAKLAAMLPHLDILHQESAIDMFLDLGPRLDNDSAEALMRYCEDEHLLMPSNVEWFATAKRIVECFYHDQTRPQDLRLMVVKSIERAWDAIETLSPKLGSELALDLLTKAEMEKEKALVSDLTGFMVRMAEGADNGFFEDLVAKFRHMIFNEHGHKAQNATTPSNDHVSESRAQSRPTICCITVQRVVQLFVLVCKSSGRKTELLFKLFLDVVTKTTIPLDARLSALDLLCRIRATDYYALYLLRELDSNAMAAVLCRTPETSIWTHSADGPTPRLSQTQADALSKDRTFDVRRACPPLWTYPYATELPSETSSEGSLSVFVYDESFTVEDDDPKVILKMAFWVEAIISMLQQTDIDWELYSFLIAHLGSQLMNQDLFRGCMPQIKFLRGVLCDQIRNASFREPPSSTFLKKADVATCLIHTLTVMIAYRGQFARSEEDEIVRTFTYGVGAWDKTTKWCVHALFVCCHELPVSVSRMLDSIVQKMSQTITQAHAAIHILEFLVMLARMPELFRNFRDDEFKMVFGVSFRYLQYVRQRQERNAEMSDLPTRVVKQQMRQSKSGVSLNSSSTDQAPIVKDNSEDLPQYVYALAFHVITFWFMNLRLDDRPTYMPWISKNLTYQTSDGNDVVEDQGLVTMDLMERIAYTDRDETSRQHDFASEVDGEISTRTWIVGYSLLTVETAGRTGLSQITRRRPSGTKYSILKPTLTRPPRHQVPLTFGVAAETFYASSYTGVLPEDVMQEFYSSYNLLDTRNPRPICLPDDEAVGRAIRTFDRNSTVDGHKVGVIYMAPGQEVEQDILANTSGSVDYTSFVSRLGFLTRLKGAGFNTQGLDQSEDTDGKFTYCWRDRATEIVYHITTMMPTNKDHDPQCIKKKSHIGNDFVNIVWNESSHDFNFESFPSQFNYVFIVITPQSSRPATDTTATLALSKTNSDPTTSTDAPPTPPPPKLYKIQVLSAPGFPKISPASESKLLTSTALPDFIRLVALNASVFSLVWQHREGGEHFSPWRNRLREIQRLREKYSGTQIFGPGGAKGTGRDSGLRLGAQSPDVGMGKLVPPTTAEKAAKEAGLGR